MKDPKTTLHHQRMQTLDLPPQRNPYRGWMEAEMESEKELPKNSEGEELVTAVNMVVQAEQTAPLVEGLLQNPGLLP